MVPRLGWNPQSSCLSLHNESGRGALMVARLESQNVTKAELKVAVIFPSLLPAHWDYRHEPLHLVCAAYTYVHRHTEATG